MMNYNLILDTDSYKASHFLQYPQDIRGLFAYIESRGGQYDHTLFFGLQYILQRYLSTRIDPEMIDEAEEFFAAHGEPFNRAGWELVRIRHLGRLPLEIRAVPEGTLVPVHMPLVTVRSTDRDLAWLASYVETLLLRVWYPTTVATRSWYAKQIIAQYLEETSDDPAGQLPFKLHDFGARGVSSEESAGIGGMAHLVNFQGTDTVSAIRYARDFYAESMAGFSIPASEHSTITSWGRENELDAYRNMLQQFGGEGKLFACVVDSYDIREAVNRMWGEALREEIQNRKAMVVIRPDSGNPVEVALETAKALHKAFGGTRNGKGFQVLNNARLIYGDGINETTIRGILMELKAHGFSADNVAFGMGGALLQQLNRDTQKMAMKTSAIKRATGWMDVYKDPVTDPGKRSKRGLLSTYRNKDTGEWVAARIEEAHRRPELVDQMRTVWRNGAFEVYSTLQAVRRRAQAG